MYCPMNAMQCRHYAAPPASQLLSKLALASITSIPIDDHQVGPIQLGMREMLSNS